MHKVRITRLAQADLNEVQERGLAEFGPDATRTFMQCFDRIFAHLGMYPLIGAARPEYGRAVRACLHSPYRVLYRFEADVVSIVGVIHASRRPRIIDDTVQ